MRLGLSALLIALSLLGSALGSFTNPIKNPNGSDPYMVSEAFLVHRRRRNINMDLLPRSIPAATIT